MAFDVGEALARLARLSAVKSDLIEAFGESCVRHELDRDEANDAAEWFFESVRKSYDRLVPEDS